MFEAWDKEVEDLSLADNGRSEILYTWIEYCIRHANSTKRALRIYGELYEEAKQRFETEAGDEYVGCYRIAEEKLGNLTSLGWRLRNEALESAEQLR